MRLAAKAWLWVPLFLGASVAAAQDAPVAAIGSQATLLRAQQVVTARDRAQYPGLVRALREVVAHQGPAEADARAWLAWIEADVQVLAARRLFELGERERALALLEIASDNEVLGPRAREQLAALTAEVREAPLPGHAISADEPRVVSTAGREIPRSCAVELRDPEDGRAFYLALYDPVVLRTASCGTGGCGDSLLDVLAGGADRWSAGRASGPVR